MEMCVRTDPLWAWLRPMGIFERTEATMLLLKMTETFASTDLTEVESSPTETFDSTADSGARHEAFEATTTSAEWLPFSSSLAGIFKRAL